MPKAAPAAVPAPTASSATSPRSSARALTAVEPAAGSARPLRPWTAIVDGRRLRLARRRHGLSQDQLADQAGISLTTVARLERQPRPRCHTRTLAQLAAALGEHPDTITPVLGLVPADPPAACGVPAPPLTGGASGMPVSLMTCARLATEFSASYHIRVEAAGYRRPRYVATAVELGTRPYAIVTADPDELRAALATALR